MTEQLKPLTDAETTELLDWVSACQSSYHIDSTPGHRFGGLGSHLQENRDSVVEYVNALIAARAQPAQAVPVLTRDELHDMRNEARSDVQCMDEVWWMLFARRVEQSVLAKRVPMPPEDWSVFNSGAEVASGLTWAEAWDYMTPSRIERGWTAVCVANKSNIGIVGEKGGA